MFSESIREDFYHCLKCGICQQACPTFKVMRQEYFAPRGRVQVIKHYLEGDLKAGRDIRTMVMSCILCDACAAACPSGVRIDRLFRNMRLELADALGIAADKRLLFFALRNPSLMRRASGIARMAQKLMADIVKINLKMGNIPIPRFPRLNQDSFRRRVDDKIAPFGKKIGRVLYFTGCATDLVYEDVGHAAVKVLAGLGMEVIIPKEQVCCGAPIFLSGAGKLALPNVFTNLEVLDRVDVDAIVVDCATCGSALQKGIPELLEDLGYDADKAKRVATKVKDISQIVAERFDELELDDSVSTDQTVVTYHDPCHLARGMGVRLEPRKILNALDNIQLVEMEDSADCCGGGGSYQFENIDVSSGITARKRGNILATGAQIVATGCPGCRLTLTGNMRNQEHLEVLHTIQLLASRLRKRH